MFSHGGDFLALERLFWLTFSDEFSKSVFVCPLRHFAAPESFSLLMLTDSLLSLDYKNVSRDFFSP